MHHGNVIVNIFHSLLKSAGIDTELQKNSESVRRVTQGSFPEIRMMETA